MDDYGLELSQKEGYVEVAEDLNGQKWANEKGYSNIDIIDDFPEEVFLVSEVANRSAHEIKVTYQPIKRMQSLVPVQRPCLHTKAWHMRAKLQ